MNLINRFSRYLVRATQSIQRRLDPFSLQFRLTVGATVVSILGISAVAVWTTWKTQQILVSSYKQNIQDIATRFPQDVAVYSEMMAAADAIRRAVDLRTLPNVMVVVTRSDGTIEAQSRTTWQSQNLVTQMVAQRKDSIAPEVYEINDRYVILCRVPLVVNGSPLGILHVAQDITSDHTMFLAVIRNLGIGSILAILAIAIVLQIYIQRSLSPLRQMSQLTETISIEDLETARAQLRHAPTEVKELIQTCERILIRLLDSLEQQRQFVGNVSHELRTPLTVVYGYIQSTLRRGTLTEAQRDALKIAAAETDRVIRLLQDLLDLARADSGHIHLTLEVLSLNSLVEDILAMADGFSDRPISLEVTHNPIWVKVDQNRFKQVVLNLIDNALKYSEPHEPIALKLSQTGDQVILQVCDRGYGIPLQHQARVFDRFYRVDEARSRSTGGYGLGLSIVKTLVESMGGIVTVRSRLNEGSIFTITLPAVS